MRSGPVGIRALAVLESAVGYAFGGAFFLLGALRRSKPLHPRGAVFQAHVHRHGSVPAWEVRWLDTLGEDPALVRFSRSAGLPDRLPDILGLAVRVQHDGHPVDLLLSTTGRRPLTRFLLRPRRRPSGLYCTLFPYRAPRSPVLLAAIPQTLRPLPASLGGLAAAVDRTPKPFQLACASPGGQWRPFATLAVTGPASSHTDPPISFDPIRNPPPGLEHYGWSVRLRGPAYAGARRSRCQPDSANMTTPRRAVPPRCRPGLS